MVLFRTVHGEAGTTPGFIQIFHGRCFEYLDKYTKSAGFLENAPTPEGRGAFCENIWKIFHKAFAFKDPCKLELKAYDDFFQATGTVDIPDKVDCLLIVVG